MSCNTAGAGLFNFKTYTNGTVRQQFYFTDQDGEAYDFSVAGWSAQMQIRAADTDTGSAELDINTTTATASGSILSFPDGEEEDGGFEVYIHVDDIAAIGAGDYVYDIVLTDAAGDSKPFARGAFQILEGVTE